MPSERIAKKPENTEKNQNQIHSQTPRKVIKLKKFSRNMPQGTTSSIYEQPPQQSKESSQMEFEKILAFFLGNQLVITLKNGASYEGILDAVNLETMEYTFKFVRSVPRAAGKKPISIWSVLGQDIAILKCANFDPQSSVSTKKKASGFQTDTGISQTSGSKERTLEMWTGDEPADQSMSLDYNSKEKWDQFAVNEKKFGVSTDFNEDMYTTVLDKSDPNFIKKEKEAQRIAKEIERGISSNPHVAEERGQIIHGKDVDEEAIYSSVARVNPNPKKRDYDANLKKFEQMAKPRPPTIIPTREANIIRKVSIDRIESGVKQSSRPGSGVSSSTTAAPPPVGTFDKASLAESSEKFSAILAKQPLEDLKKKFKPFANDMKSHLTDRKQAILKEGRNEVIKDFKAFATGFKIPVFSKSQESIPDIPEETKTEATGKPKVSTASVATSPPHNPVPKHSEETTQNESVEGTVTGDAESASTGTASATTTKPKFKLSASASEFTPSGYTPGAPSYTNYNQNKRTGKEKGFKGNYKGNQNAQYYNNPNYYPNPDYSYYQGGYAPYMPPPPRGGYQMMPMPPYGYPMGPGMYPGPPQYGPNGAIMPPYMIDPNTGAFIPPPPGQEYQAQDLENAEDAQPNPNNEEQQQNE